MSFISNLSFNNLNKIKNFDICPISDKTNFSNKNLKSFDYKYKNPINLVLNNSKNKNKYNNCILFEKYRLNKISSKNISKQNSFNISKLEGNKTLKNNNFSSTFDLSVNIKNIFPFFSTSIISKNIEKEKLLKKEKSFQKRNKMNNQVLNKSIIHNESVKKYIIKTRKLILEKYIQFYKKERINRINEDYQTIIGNINDKLNFLKESKSLLIFKFLNKFNDHIKKLYIKIEEEKNLNNQYIKKINLLKYEINKLNNKIKNIQNNKDSLERWMYLQIQFHEKIKTIPNYYIQIINNEYDKNNPNNLNENEINKIKLYKKNMIYRTGDEFLNKLKEFENKNIFLIKIYNNLRISNKELLKEFNLLKIENKKNNENLYYILELKIKIINELKARNIFLENKIKKLNKQNDSYNYHIKRSLSLNLNNKTKLKQFQFQFKKEKIVENLHSKLYIKICEIEKNVKNLIPNQKIKTYKLFKESENIEMLKKLKTIEIGLNKLIDNNKKYKFYYSKEIEKINLKIEKVRKIKKNKIQREYLKNKINELKKNIIERSNKIYFLPKKKIERYNKPLIINNKLKKLNETNKIKEEDFFYDMNLNINNISYI